VAQQSQRAEQSQAARRPLRTWLVYFLIAFAVLFAAFNLDQVEVDWIIGTWETPLLVVILLCLALGAGIGWFAARQQSAR
jgi:uncharacterized integral membrane protein